MNNINKVNVDCLPPRDWSTLIGQTNVTDSDESLGNFAWPLDDVNYNYMSSFASANLGRPLKYSDFKDYLIMPLYAYNDTTTLDVYMPGAVIAYVKAGQRYLTDYGSGAYVHLGTKFLYDPFDNKWNCSDFGKGFVGTAAALWVEADRFKPSTASWSKSNGVNDWKATVFVHPATIGFSKDNSYIYARLGFAIHSIYQFPQGYESWGAGFEQAKFDSWIDSSNWSDVRMKLGINNPALSKQAIGFGTELLDLNTEKEEEFRGLAVSSIISIGAKISGIDTFFSVVGGLRLAAQWGGFVMSGEESGIDEYAQEAEMGYVPYSLNGDPVDGYVYSEISSVVVADVRIPLSTRTGWLKLPLTYLVRVSVDTGIPGDPYYWIGPIQETLEVAIYFDRGAGQEDAGVPGDAGGSSANARGISFPGSYYGYLDGSADSEDWYNFTVPSGKPIAIQMTPPPFVNFDLELRRPDGSVKANSSQGAGLADTIQCIADVAGTWSIRVNKVQGSGVYSLILDTWGQYLTVDTKVYPRGGRLANVQVWINGVQYNSPVTINAAPGTTYNIVVETIVIRAWTIYVLDHWNDGHTSNSTTVFFPSTGNVTLTAYYGDACPTLFVWNGSEYAYDTVLNIHAESDITVQHQIQEQLVPNGILYKLELRELDNFTSHIDQVKLYAVDSSGERHLCPLIYANHNGTLVTLTLLLDDDRRVDLTPTETISLKFIRPIPYCETAYFIFEINGYNKKIP
jgi:hypothetical protein